MSVQGEIARLEGAKDGLATWMIENGIDVPEGARLGDMVMALYSTVIPHALSDLEDDSTHRTVTDTEKATWNAKSNFSGNYADLSGKPTIPSLSGYATESYVNNYHDSTKISTTDGAVGSSNLASSAVTAAKIASNAVTTAKINAAAVTRAKLANDALYTPVVTASTSRAITISDLGKTIRASGTSVAFTFTIALAEFQSWPTGYEVEVYWNTASSVKIKGCTGLYFGHEDAGAFIQNSTITLNKRFSIVALKKVASDSILVTGSAKVAA